MAPVAEPFNWKAIDHLIESSFEPAGLSSSCFEFFLTILIESFIILLAT